MLGKAMKAYRRKNKLTQAAMAAEINKACTWCRLAATVGDVRKWERIASVEEAYTAEVNYNMVIAVSDLTGKSVVSLLTFPE